MTILEASKGSPILAKLTELTTDSQARLKAIESMIPESLHAAIKSGPIEGSVWCLILDSNAAAAKIRQLLPAFKTHLRVRGWEIDSIRLKVLSPKKR